MKILLLLLAISLSHRGATQVCPAVFSIYGFNIGATKVKVYWSSANATSYQLYKLRITPPTSGVWELAATTSSLNAEATGLSPNTTYQFAVKAICANGTWRDYYHGFYVTTFLTDPPTCPAPSTLLTTSIGSFNAYVRFDLVTYLLGWTMNYKVYYRPQGTSTWQSVAVPIDNPNTPQATPRFPMLLTGLTPNTTYEWIVENQCSQYAVGSNVNYSNMATFTTVPEQSCYTSYLPSPFAIPQRDYCYPWIGYCPGSLVTAHGRYSSLTFIRNQANVTPEFPQHQATAIINSAPQYVDLLPPFHANLFANTLYEANIAPLCAYVITQFRQAPGATDSTGERMAQPVPPGSDSLNPLPPYFAVTSNSGKEPVGITVYPNPTGGVVNIGIPNSNETIKRVQLFDGSGKIAYQSMANTRTLNIGHLAQGLYYFSIATSKTTYHGKIVKTGYTVNGR